MQIGARRSAIQPADLGQTDRNSASLPARRLQSARARAALGPPVSTNRSTQSASGGFTMYVTTTRRQQEPLSSLRRLNSFLDEAFGNWPMHSQENGTLTSSWIPACDVFEDQESVKIIAEVPGVKPEDVKISLENNLLTIRGEKRQQAEETNERVHRYERTYGAFERAFALPTTVDPEKIAANYANGVLTVTIPKADRARPREIPVNVG
jgi:HSP20 family protein